MSFNNLDLIDPIKQALIDEGYTTPTPIQEQAIPIILQGKDLLGCAQTGTGKTAAFAIPILQTLHLNQTNQKGRRTIQALIITPTRELAIQIGESFKAYGQFTSLQYAVIFGGVKQGAQTSALHNGVDILVATPGRLLDLMNQGFVNLKHIKIFVLDEADRMLDMGFIHDVKRIIAAIPTHRQTLFFSATMPAEIVKLSSSILKNPVKVEVTPVSSTAETIQQFVYFVDKNNKNALLLHLLEDKAIETALVFTRTKHGADKVVKLLQKHEIKALAIHGNKSQNARQNALNSFKQKETRVLVATDIAARGIDIDELAYVINFDIPNIAETYVHRIGRTGRAGANGIAYSLCEQEEVPFLKDVQRLIGMNIPIIKDHPYHLTNLSVVTPQKPDNRNQHQRNKPQEQRSRPQPRSESGEKPKPKWFKRK